MSYLMTLWVVLAGLLGIETGGIDYQQYLQDEQIAREFTNTVTQHQYSDVELNAKLADVELQLGAKPIAKPGGGIDWIGAQ